MLDNVFVQMLVIYVVAERFLDVVLNLYTSIRDRACFMISIKQ